MKVYQAPTNIDDDFFSEDYSTLAEKLFIETSKLDVVRAALEDIECFELAHQISQIKNTIEEIATVIEDESEDLED